MPTTLQQLTKFIGRRLQLFALNVLCAVRCGAGAHSGLSENKHVSFIKKFVESLLREESGCTHLQGVGESGNAPQGSQRCQSWEAVAAPHLSHDHCVCKVVGAEMGGPQHGCCQRSPLWRRHLPLEDPVVRERSVQHLLGASTRLPCALAAPLLLLRGNSNTTKFSQPKMRSVLLKQIARQQMHLEMTTAVRLPLSRLFSSWRPPEEVQQQVAWMNGQAQGVSAHRRMLPVHTRPTRKGATEAPGPGAAAWREAPPATPVPAAAPQRWFRPA